jgi:tetratricopeptide (TPR) repeat protein
LYHRGVRPHAALFPDLRSIGYDAGGDVCALEKDRVDMAGLIASWRSYSLLARARRFLLQQRAEEAWPLCQEAVALTPRWASAWRYLTWAAALLRRDDVMLDACERALAIQPRDVWSWSNKASALIRLDRGQEALEANERALAIRPRDIWSWMLKANALLRLKRDQDALDALAHTPRSGQYAVFNGRQRALAPLRLKRYEAMREQAEWLVTQDRSQFLNWLYLGQALDGLKRHEESLAAYATAARLNPASPGAWKGQALALTALRRSPAALDACERGLSLAPNDKVLWRGKALCLMRERRFDEALAVYDHIMTMPDPVALDFGSRGIALYRVGRYAEAAQMYGAALKRQPADYISLINLGCVYIRLQYDECALKIFSRARALDVRRVTSWTNLAEAQIALGRLDEAEASIARAEELRRAGVEPEHAVFPPLLIGVVRTRQGRLDEAQASFAAALAIDPEHAEALMDYAEMLLARGETQQATATIARSIVLDPHDVRAWSLRGRILRAAGDASGADAAEAHGQAMLAEQRAALAAWEREHPELARLGGDS